MQAQEFCKENLIIDKHDLDNELVQHASLFSEAAEHAVQASARMDYLKEELAVVDSEVATSLRTSAVNEGRKVTEAALAALVLQHSAHKEAHKALIDAKAETAQWNAARESFSTRGHMLRDLCQLYIAEYYTKASVEGPDAAKVEHKSSRERLSSKRKSVR